ncbi:MAG: glycosyltransferase [Candidatus Eremiobacteraeota bacterium]|nr:glycosyltransferase [Candidatus Eremiobacteraeota bacterium]
MPLVSCVIPSYNYARYLRAAIESALGQTHRDIEVIVVDDGSTDESIEVLRSYGDRIRWIAQANQGVSAARNAGIREARGEFIGFLDSDDAWRPTKIERQLSLMDDPEVGLVHCWVCEIDGDGRTLQIVGGGMRGWPLVEHAQLQSTVLGGGSGALLRRKCFDELGGFDVKLSMSADWDMWRRVMGKYRVELVEEALLDYRIHAPATQQDTPFRQQSKRLALYEHDVLRAFDSMFADPDAATVRPYKRLAYAKAYSVLAASHYVAGQPGRAARYVINSVLLSPGPLTQMLLRKARREVGTLARRNIPGSAPIAE